MNRILKDIDSKQVEIDNMKSKINQVASLLVDEETETKPVCSMCHQAGHKKNKCASEKCLTSQCCGKIRLHKDELKSHDNCKLILKKLTKEKSVLESEILKLQDTILATSRSFHERVKTSLINSNKNKYLTIYGHEIVPLTKLVNVDLSILQKHYKNKVPDDLEFEASNFAHIIEGHMAQFQRHETSINSKLSESVRRVDSKIQYSSQSSTTTPLQSVPPNTDPSSVNYPLLSPISANFQTVPIYHTTGRYVPTIPPCITDYDMLTPKYSNNETPQNLTNQNFNNTESLCISTPPFAPNTSAIVADLTVGPSQLSDVTNTISRPQNQNRYVPSMWYQKPQKPVSFEKKQLSTGTETVSMCGYTPVSKNANVTSQMSKKWPVIEPTATIRSDYEHVYDQFNIKPKHQFIQRYNTGLHVPELD